MRRIFTFIMILTFTVVSGAKPGNELLYNQLVSIQEQIFNMDRSLTIPEVIEKLNMSPEEFISTVEKAKIDGIISDEAFYIGKKVALKDRTKELALGEIEEASMRQIKYAYNAGYVAIAFFVLAFIYIEYNNRFEKTPEGQHQKEIEAKTRALEMMTVETAISNVVLEREKIELKRRELEAESTGIGK